MKISLEWLSQYLPGPLDARELGELLTHAGLPTENFERPGDDTVMDVEVTSNRGDCLSHIGVARELAALSRREARLPEVRAAESATPAASVTSVAIEAPRLCPHYTARVIRNVRVGPSPAWMVRRLEAVGLRSINNVVDVTNYVMFEMGQPLHTFDFDRLGGRRIVVREAMPGEKIVSIDQKERILQPGMLVIADATEPVAVAGVMGGLDSEVSGATVNILLESARFDPLSVRTTARALTMASDSSYRFERQIDPTLPERASLRAAQLIVELAGGELLAGLVSAGESGYAPRSVTLRLPRLQQVLGVSFPAEQVVEALARLGMRPVLKGDAVEATVPSWRLDVNIEVDLIEEVARVIGYDKIPMRDEVSIRLTPPNREKQTLDEIAAALVGAGYFESLTVSFVSDNLALDRCPPLDTWPLRAVPPVRKGDARLRPSVLPGLLEAVRRNESVGTMGAKLFEIGPTFWIGVDGSVEERRRVGMVGSTDYREVRGAVEAVLARLDPHRFVAVVPDAWPGYTAGACGRIEWGGEAVGYIGAVDRKILEKLSLREAPVAAELDLAPLLRLARPVRQLRDLPRVPAVARDLSLVVAEKVTYAEIDALIHSLGLADLEDVHYITTYRGKPLEKGFKSVSLHLVFRSGTSTLTSPQVEEAVQKAIAAAKEKLGATLRV